MEVTILPAKVLAPCCGREVDRLATRDECDTCYRHRRRAEDALEAGREAGQTGRPPLDNELYKVRGRTDAGSQTWTYSDGAAAARKARALRAAGHLEFYARYRIAQIIELGD